jgi:hypothetical protein
MAVMLKITFTGLFTFVPSSDGKQLVVLLPRTGVLSPGNRVHQHHAHLIVERDHAPPHPRHPQKHPNCAPQAAQTGVYPTDTGHRDHTEHANNTDAHGIGTNKNVECIPFGCYRLVFTGLVAGPHVMPPPASVDLTPYAGKLDSKQLGPSPDDAVWAQVVLPGATTELAAPDTAHWKMGDDGPEMRMSHQVIWTTEVSDVASIEFWHLGGGKAGKFALKPKKNETTICMEIEHLPHKNDRHKGEQCQDAPHFLAYYDLFGISKEEPLPVLTEGERVDDKLTCMTSQATSG